MPVEDRSSQFHSRISGRSVLPGALTILFAACVCALLSTTACMTRSDTPSWAPDSTLVYPSKMTNDVNATISFQLKDSAARDAIKKADKDRRREITKLKRKRDDILALEEDRQRKAQADAKRKAEAEKKSKGKKKKKAADDDAPAPIMTPRPDPAVRDSLEAIQKRITALETEDSLSTLLPWKLKREDGSVVGEHSFEIEEGASVRATIRLENVYARGKRPLMFHFVWLNPEKKRVFKRMVEYVPNDSTQTLTSTLSITPTKRSAGHYSLQVFLFREQIAEKWFELTGKGKEEDEKGDEGM